MVAPIKKTLLLTCQTVFLCCRLLNWLKSLSLDTPGQAGHQNWSHKCSYSEAGTAGWPVHPLHSPLISAQTIVIVFENQRHCGIMGWLLVVFLHLSVSLRWYCQVSDVVFSHHRNRQRYNKFFMGATHKSMFLNYTAPNKKRNKIGWECKNRQTSNSWL